MNSTSACLTDDALEQLRHDEMPPAQLRAVEAHLCECLPCRERLAEAESDELWREQIAPALRIPPESPPTASSLELDPLGEAALESVLKLLGPTDDPQMLGRIGNYEIVGVVGRGGMGVVFKAFDPALHRFVAIKMLLPHLAVSGAARQRFAREGKAAAAVIDDHVLPIYSVSEWRGTPYLVTQYVRGATLEARLATQGPLEVKEILRIAMQTAKGLAAAHAQGLVHRDVKPSNILLDGAVERAMLTDFGLARATDDASITRTGVIAGTPQYMSPEQARGETVDARADLFGLGCVMYAMCTGRPPFRAENSYAILRLITDQEPRAIREINPEIPPWLCTIIRKLMAKDAMERYSSAAEVAHLLEACLAHLQQPTTAKLPTSLASSQGRGSWTWTTLIACGLAAFGFFAGVLIVLELNKGTLTIESKVDDVKIKISRGEKVVRELELHQKATSLRIAAGEYRIEIEGNTEGLEVDNGRISLSRGETEVVRIQLRDRPDAVTAAEERADHEEVAIDDRPLKEVVAEFNREKSKAGLGASSLPLTTEEVVAAVRWMEQSGEISLLQEEAKLLQTISEKQILPAAFRIELLTELQGDDGDRIRVGFIQLAMKRADGSEYRFNLREQFICCLDENGNEAPFGGVLGWLPPNGWQKLEDVIHRFNQSFGRLNGINMPPVTQEEVRAAIRYWRTQRDKFDATDIEFEALQDIARIGYMPPGSGFTIVTHAEPGDGREYLVWSLRIHLAKTEQGARSSTYGGVFRRQFVSSAPSDEAKIAWGPVAKNGMQAGLLLKSGKNVVGLPWPASARAEDWDPNSPPERKEEVAYGATLQPVLYLRNVGEEEIETSFLTSYPLSELGLPEAVFEDGVRVKATQTQNKGQGEIEITEPERLKRGDSRRAYGPAVLIGEGDLNKADAVLDVRQNDRLRIRFTVPVWVNNVEQRLTTDWVELLVN
jgi:serine/threonine protein kinase